MSVKDVIKQSVLSGIGGGAGFDFWEILLILFAAFVMGIYIFFIYKAFSKSAFYSKDLNITIASLGIIVAAIMIAMQSNILVSLGMVGALSIVRFRTAIKNPLDLLYLFWALSGGIICGVGLYLLAAMLCIIMTFILWGLDHIPVSKAPIVVIIRGENAGVSEECQKTLNTCCKYVHKCQSMVKNGEYETIYEVNTVDIDKLVTSISDIAGVKSVNCLEHDGEIRG